MKRGEAHAGNHIARTEKSMREKIHSDDHPWDNTSIVDEAAIDHERCIGTVRLANDEILVRVAQRVDFDLLTDPIGVRVSPPRITLGRMFELDDAEGEQVENYLHEAVAFIRSLSSTSEVDPSGEAHLIVKSPAEQLLP
jgi:hypothetical protein